MPKRVNAWFCLLLATCWILSAVGCGPSMLTVEGNVTWDGTPVETGTISFLPADGKGPTYGGEIKGGSYRVEAEKEAALGSKKVAITAVRKTGKQVEAGPPAPAGTMVDELQNISSNEACDIADGPNQHNFELKSAAR